MAKHRPPVDAETCIFCGEEPCVCTAAAPPPKRTRKKIEPKDSKTKDKPPADAVVTPGPKKSKFKKAAEVAAAEKAADVDYDEIAALEALMPILSTQDQVKAQEIINRPRPAATWKKLSEWKKRNGLAS